MKNEKWKKKRKENVKAKILPNGPSNPAPTSTLIDSSFSGELNFLKKCH